MNRAARCCGRNARYDCRHAGLYVARLYLYVYGGTRPDCLQHLLKRWKGDTRSQLETVELCQRNRGDRAPGDGRIEGRRKEGVVMDHNSSITRCMNVELDAVGARIQCRFEGRKRILGVSVANATVGNYFRVAQIFSPIGEGGCLIIICVNVRPGIASNMRVE